jgi:hypothetical protein
MLLFNINMHKLKYIKILYIYMLLYLCKYSISPIIKKKIRPPIPKILVLPLPPRADHAPARKNCKATVWRGPDQMKTVITTREPVS